MVLFVIFLVRVEFFKILINLVWRTKVSSFAQVIDTACKKTELAIIKDSLGEGFWMAI